jgi:hypothetical protein
LIGTHAVRLAPPPPDRRITPWHEHTELLRSLATALAALQQHETRLARALELGDIDLPPGAPNAQDRAQLQAAAPLYFASELELAGLLSAAELIAGLFASGTITQPLGPTAQLLHDFWRARRERLDARERTAIFARVIEAPHFDRLMGALCESIVAQADGGDLRERVALEAAAHLLGEFLAQRVDAMAAIAARDVVENINTALVFMRDRRLQLAFGVQSLWSLVAAGGGGTAQRADRVQRHVDQGRSGQTVLLWLAEHGLDPVPLLDPNSAEGLELIGAAQRWLSGRIVAPSPAASPAFPIAA